MNKQINVVDNKSCTMCTCSFRKSRLIHSGRLIEKHSGD